MDSQDKKQKRKRQLKKIAVFLDNFITIISVVLAVLIIAGGVFYLVLPKYKAISKEMESSIEIKTRELDALNSYSVKLNNYLSTYSQVSQSDIQKLDKMIPSKTYDKEELFAYMEKFLGNRGLIMDSINLKEESSRNRNNRRASSGGQESGALPPQVERVEMKINIVGLDYEGLKKLLNEFERNLRLMDVEQVSFQQDEGKVSLSVVTYYLADID